LWCWKLERQIEDTSDRVVRTYKPTDWDVSDKYDDGIVEVEEEKERG